MSERELCWFFNAKLKEWQEVYVSTQDCGSTDKVDVTYSKDSGARTYSVRRSNLSRTRPEGVGKPKRARTEDADVGPPSQPKRLRTEDSLLSGSSGRSGSVSIYVDGSCIGNVHVRDQAQPTGWGVCIQGAHTLELYGPVVTCRQSPFFDGAEHGSNNTAELTAMIEALHWLMSSSVASATLFYDSKYAANIMTKVYNAQKNKELASKLQALYEKAKAKISITLTYIKGHSHNAGNDAADRLAKLGASGQQCRVGRFAGLPVVGSSTPRRPSTTGTSVRSNTPMRPPSPADLTQPEPDPEESSDAVLCTCGEVATVKTARTAANNGRQFHSCAKDRKDKRNCNFFQWLP